jgi:hypothetical protein
LVQKQVLALSVRPQVPVADLRAGFSASAVLLRDLHLGLLLKGVLRCLPAQVCYHWHWREIRVLK